MQKQKYGKNKPNQMSFLKPIDKMVTMTNGHLRVFFGDGNEIILTVGKRGPVLPRRKRAEARAKGVIR